MFIEPLIIVRVTINPARYQVQTASHRQRNEVKALVYFPLTGELTLQEAVVSYVISRADLDRQYGPDRRFAICPTCSFVQPLDEVDPGGYRFSRHDGLDGDCSSSGAPLEG